jgi:hypothetical protein
MVKKTILSIICSLSFIFPWGLISNWQNLDLQQDAVFGISTEKAYQEILSKKKKFKPVIVAVIDSGVDTAHGTIDKEILEPARMIRSERIGRYRQCLPGASTGGKISVRIHRVV